GTAEGDGDQSGEDHRKEKKNEGRQRRADAPPQILAHHREKDAHQSRSSRPVSFKNSAFKLGGSIATRSTARPLPWIAARSPAAPLPAAPPVESATRPASAEITRTPGRPA